MPSIPPAVRRLGLALLAFSFVSPLHARVLKTWADICSNLPERVTTCDLDNTFGVRENYVRYLDQQLEAYIGTYDMPLQLQAAKARYEFVMRTGDRNRAREVAIRQFDTRHPPEAPASGDGRVQARNFREVCGITKNQVVACPGTQVPRTEAEFEVLLEEQLEQVFYFPEARVTIPATETRPFIYSRYVQTIRDEARAAYRAGVADPETTYVGQTPVVIQPPSGNDSGSGDEKPGGDEPCSSGAFGLGDCDGSGKPGETQVVKVESGMTLGGIAQQYQGDLSGASGDDPFTLWGDLGLVAAFTAFNAQNNDGLMESRGGNGAAFDPNVILLGDEIQIPTAAWIAKWFAEQAKGGA